MGLARCLKLLAPEERMDECYSTLFLDKERPSSFPHPSGPKFAATLRQLVVIVRVTGSQSWKSCRHIMARSCRWKNRPQHQGCHAGLGKVTCCEKAT